MNYEDLIYMIRNERGCDDGVDVFYQLADELLPDVIYPCLFNEKIFLNSYYLLTEIDQMFFARVANNITYNDGDREEAIENLPVLVGAVNKSVPTIWQFDDFVKSNTFQEFVEHGDELARFRESIKAAPDLVRVGNESAMVSNTGELLEWMRGLDWSRITAECSKTHLIDLIEFEDAFDFLSYMIETGASASDFLKNSITNQDFTATRAFDNIPVSALDGNEEMLVAAVNAKVPPKVIASQYENWDLLSKAWKDHNISMDDLFCGCGN